MCRRYLSGRGTGASQSLELVVDECHGRRAQGSWITRADDPKPGGECNPLQTCGRRAAELSARDVLARIEVLDTAIGIPRASSSTVRHSANRRRRHTAPSHSAAVAPLSQVRADWPDCPLRTARTTNLSPQRRASYTLGICSYVCVLMLDDGSTSYLRAASTASSPAVHDEMSSDGSR